MGRLSGKVAAVTGGASGIGEATVRLFLEHGAKVVFADRDAENGLRLESELNAGTAETIFVKAHVEQEHECATFIERANDAFGRLDILVNNAGIRKYQDVTQSSAESWAEVLGVNVMGYAFCAKAAIPLMRRGGGGAIVCVASVRSLISGPSAVLYDTSKAGVLGLIRAMAHDHAADNVRVNAVGPGPIMTPFHEHIIEESDQSRDAYVEKFGSTTMMNRPGTAQEVANGILFLASDDASFITGTCLYIDGGQTAL